MATKDETQTMRAKGDANPKAVAPSLINAPPEPAPVVKAREVIRRPPLPQVSLYDAYLVKAPGPIPISRPAETVLDAPITSEETAAPEHAHQGRSDSLTVSPADARQALEAWQATAFRPKPRSGTR